MTVPGSPIKPTEAPLWLLDVDGVLNAVAPHSLDAFTQRRINGFMISWRQPLIDRMKQLHETRAVEIRWLTTWCDDAASKIAPALGLPLDCAVEGTNAVRSDRFGGWWKSSVAKRLSDADPERPLIWTDDDLEYSESRGDVDWLADRSGPTLALSPYPREGLSDSHLHRIETFLAAYAPVPAPVGGGQRDNE